MQMSNGPLILAKRPVRVSLLGVVVSTALNSIYWFRNFTGASTMTTSTRDVQKEIHDLVTSQKVVLFMKGSPQFPQCGFSAAATKMLMTAGCSDFASVNVLADNDIREGIKTYANWPTIPQLYINGEFVGGADIMREMAQSGELDKLLNT
jgi:monothiol glutaredoxin